MATKPGTAAKPKTARRTTRSPAGTAGRTRRSAQAEAPTRRAPRHKGVNLALQGGGAHGAYTWGVLDRMFEDDRVWIESLSGTSAGAMNAVVAAQGMVENGAEGARERLRSFWEAVSRAAATSPLRRSPLAVLFGEYSLAWTPAYLAYDIASRIASPYDLNPLDINPLRDLVVEQVDFEKVCGLTEMPVYVGATNAETGLARVFTGKEISLDTVMASACLPSMFKAVIIDGDPYWDGGYSGNPPLYPFLEKSLSDDVMIVQVNPICRPGVPRTAHEIQNRVNEVTFNSALMHELRAIHMVNRMVEAGEVVGSRRMIRFHIVSARKAMRHLDASSKLNAQWPFLMHLFEIGRATASAWLDAHFDDLGERSTVDLDEMLCGIGGPAPALGIERKAQKTDEGAQAETQAEALEAALDDGTRPEVEQNPVEALAAEPQVVAATPRRRRRKPRKPPASSTPSDQEDTSNPG